MGFLSDLLDDIVENPEKAVDLTYNIIDSPIKLTENLEKILSDILEREKLNATSQPFPVVGVESS